MVERAKITQALSIACALAAAGCGSAHEVGEAAEPTVVETAVAETGRVTEWLEIQGHVAPPVDHDASLSPLVAGRIVALSARVGDSVSEGAILARVETAMLDDELKTAEAAARRAASDATFKRGVAKRSRDLVAKGVAAREEAEAAEAEAVSAESAQAEATAALDTARRRRGWSELRAPFAGVIVRVDRRVGDFVDGTAATPVVGLASLEGWEVAASAPAVSLQMLRANQVAVLRGFAGSTSEPGEEGEVAATVVGVARAVDPATGAGDVRLRPRARPANAALGAPVLVRVAMRTHDRAVLVPKTALRRTPEGAAEVVVIEGGVGHVRAVATGLAEGDRVEIVKGLEAGAHVVIDDPMGIADGAKLREEAPEKAGREDKGKDEK